MVSSRTCGRRRSPPSRRTSFPWTLLTPFPSHPGVPRCCAVIPPSLLVILPSVPPSLPARALPCAPRCWNTAHTPPKANVKPNSKACACGTTPAGLVVWGRGRRCCWTNVDTLTGV
ncbi:hypothetical protein GALMADRAFT_230103 [Galerina marginata CBS 339.88]|uniref:Uncharacterized protein n=1 Tax=Galerina marginata (strain CBS 339.88) TaxID=685588 RepID=A0A067SKH4_GALM3|nr:hypothetical protein GALMADRAFT_230103 [Galerina marginata CBS 339.88]